MSTRKLELPKAVDVRKKLPPTGEAEIKDTSKAAGAVLELAHREQDGVEVSLKWDQTVDQLSVEVSDSRKRDHFELQVAKDEGLDAFYHPYTYRSAGPAKRLREAQEAEVHQFIEQTRREAA